MQSVLVYNVTHSDLVLGVANAQPSSTPRPKTPGVRLPNSPRTSISLDQGIPSASVSRTSTVTPKQTQDHDHAKNGSALRRSNGADDTDSLVTESLATNLVTFARPKFSFFEPIARQALNRFSAEGGKLEHTEIFDDTMMVSTSFSQKRTVLIGFSFVNKPFNVPWNSLHLRRSAEAPLDGEMAQIVSVYLPLVTQIVPTWTRWFPLPANSSKHVLLVCGTGRPQDKSASLWGNSTMATAEVAAAFLRTHSFKDDPSASVTVMDSSAYDLYDYDENVSFIRSSLMPRIEQIRRVAASSTSKGWRTQMEVTVALTEGSPARMGALSAALRAYKPWYAHLCQLKTFWHERRLLTSDLRFYSFERVETTPPLVVSGLANDVFRAAVAELCRYRDEFLRTISNPSNELQGFWLRKTGRPVLCVLGVASPDPASIDQDSSSSLLNSPSNSRSSLAVPGLTSSNAASSSQYISRGTSYIFYRGINLEVSQPTGSLCSERNAIGSALAANPTLNRRDVALVAVLALPLLSALTQQSQASSSGLSDDKAQDVKRLRSESIRSAFSLGEGADLNPLGPCGACTEWLKKIAEVNPDFKVMTFRDVTCRECFLREVE